MDNYPAITWKIASTCMWKITCDQRSFKLFHKNFFIQSPNWLCRTLICYWVTHKDNLCFYLKSLEKADALITGGWQWPSCINSHLYVSIWTHHNLMKIVAEQTRVQCNFLRKMQCSLLQIAAEEVFHTVQHDLSNTILIWTAYTNKTMMCMYIIVLLVASIWEEIMLLVNKILLSQQNRC